MLIEQAFFHLPEILHGSGYQQQQYESGIVGAFSLALLQALNGRNVSDPISCLQNERRFRESGMYPLVENPRHFRADLFVDLSRLRTATRRLSQYGWRHYNWIEAKFLRGQAGDANQHSTNKTNYVAGHLADLLRLSLLVPEENAETACGRYFLHSYDAPPYFYLTKNREWCRTVSLPGNHLITLANLDQEVPAVRRLAGVFPGLSVQIGITNFLAFPSDFSHLPCYWSILTRIDSVAAQLGDHSFSISTQRQIQRSADVAIDEIAAFVVRRLHIPPASPEVMAPPEADGHDALPRPEN